MPAGDCGDAIGFFAIDESTDTDVVQELLTISAPGATVPAATLMPDTDYGLEAEIYNGEVDLTGQAMTTGGDPIMLVTIWEDINSINVTTAVPEPGAGLLQLAALATMACLARRRRRGC